MLIARVVAAVAVAGALAACAPVPQGDPQFEARQLAAIHQVAQDAVMRPGISCALGGFNTGGVPGAPVTDLFLQLERDGTTTREQDRDLLIELARDLWESSAGITQLSFGYAGGGPTLGEALGTINTFVRRTDLEAAFGPQTPVASPRPAFTDPGNPDC